MFNGQLFEQPSGVLLGDFKLSNSKQYHRERDAFLFKRMNLNTAERLQAANLRSGLQKKYEEAFFTPSIYLQYSYISQDRLSEASNKLILYNSPAK